MYARGLFFLRMRPSTARDPHDGALVLLLPVVEHEDRDGRRITLNELLATWRGDAASAFWALHFDELKPGRGLQLELDRMRWNGREWRASVTHCELAPLPPSWAKQAGTETPTDQPTQPLAA